jgi:GAF domain-containing protein
MEGEELKLSCWTGKYNCPIEQVPICKESIVWEVVNEGTPVNLTDPRQTNGYLHTLAEQIKIKAIIPLRYVDPLTQEEKRVGALIVDSGKEGVPISEGEFEYLKVVGELIGAAAGKAELVEQLVESYRRKEAMVREAVHVLRNATVAIGGFARRIAQLAKNTDLAQAARSVLEEAQALEVYLERFEKYM